MSPQTKTLRYLATEIIIALWNCQILKISKFIPPFCQPLQNKSLQRSRLQTNLKQKETKEKRCKSLKGYTPSTNFAHRQRKYNYFLFCLPFKPFCQVFSATCTRRKFDDWWRIASHVYGCLENNDLENEDLRPREGKPRKRWPRKRRPGKPRIAGEDRDGVAGGTKRLEECWRRETRGRWEGIMNGWEAGE